MGKTVKSRIISSVVSVLCVIALCVWANSGIPSMYQSYREKAMAKAAATRTTHQIAAPAQQPADTAPAASDVVTEEPVMEDTADTSFDMPTEDAAVYDIEEPMDEMPMDEEPVEEEEVYEEEEPVEEEAPVETEKSFFEKIVDFVTDMFSSLTSGDFFAKIKDFFAGLFSKVGIQLPF